MTEMKRVLVAAVALSTTAWLTVGSASFAASPALTANGFGAVKAVSFAVTVVDPACKPVLDANHKTLDTPTHMYSETVGGDGKKTTGELITINGERYVLFGGKWTKSPMTVAATKEQETENIKNAKVLSCKRTGDDSVNGEAAAIYTEHSENEDTKSDGKIWISKSRGVILKEEIQLDAGDPSAQRITVRYEYGNVKAPV
jgi:hypothetical protein